MGEPIRALWVPFAVLSVLILFLTLQTSTASKSAASLPGARDIFRSTLSIHRHIGELAATRAGLVLVLGATIFGITEGATGIAFRPRIVELGIQASWMLGGVQVLLTVARLSGLGVYRRTGWIMRPQTAAFCLVSSGVLYAAFAMLGQVQWALPVWLARVAILSAYFPTLKLLASETQYGVRNTASALSVLTVLSSLGTIGFSSLIASPWGAQFTTADQLLIGAIASIISGGVFLGGRIVPSTR